MDHSFTFLFSVVLVSARNSLYMPSNLYIIIIHYFLQYRNSVGMKMVHYIIPGKFCQYLKEWSWTLVTQTPLALSIWIFVELFARMHTVIHVNSFCLTNNLLGVIPASSGHSKSCLQEMDLKQFSKFNDFSAQLNSEAGSDCTPFSYQTNSAQICMKMDL